MPKLTIKRPCKDCPFRRVAAPGWLGAGTAHDFIEAAEADYCDQPLPCHLTIDYEQADWIEEQYPDAALCAGALIYTSNRCKSPRDPARSEWVRSVEPDIETVFQYPWEFYEHHVAELPPEVAQMKARSKQ